MDDAPATSLVLVRPGPAWDHARPLAAQRNAAAHLAWVRGHVAAGTALTAGPVCRHDQRLTTDLVGVIVLALPLAEATTLAQTDPAVAGGQLRMSVHPYFRVVA